jgi:hypothetical protein
MEIVHNKASARRMACAGAVRLGLRKMKCGRTSVVDRLTTYDADFGLKDRGSSRTARVRAVS